MIIGIQSKGSTLRLLNSSTMDEKRSAATALAGGTAGAAACVPALRHCRGSCKPTLISPVNHTILYETVFNDEAHHE